MPADEVTVVVTVGTPTTGEISTRVSRGETIMVEDASDMEGYAIEALRVVDNLCEEVRKEALRQVRAIMENVKRAQVAEAAARRRGGGR